jgi:hypothetical protein
MASCRDSVAERSSQLQLSARVTQFADCREIVHEAAGLACDGSSVCSLTIADVEWNISTALSPVAGQSGGVVALECRNPTVFDATVRIFAESSADVNAVLGQAASLRWPTLEIPAGATRVMALSQGKQE